MKRITKDRCARKSTSSAVESLGTSKQPRRTKKQSLIHNNDVEEAPKERNSILAKFSALERPKLRSKRPHLQVEYDKEPSEVNVKEEPLEIKQEIKVEPLDIKEEVDIDATIKIKEEPSSLSPSSSKVAKLEGSPNTKSYLKTPQNWELMLHNLREMRTEFNAPVDTMGCDMCMDKSGSPKDTRYQALISLMLSSMTKDNVTYEAMQKLIAHGCTVDKILETGDDKLGELIYPVNYWKKKVQYIKESTKIIKEEFNGDIPRTVKDLCKLKGVGPKMAHLCMKTAWDEITGIGVDTHVHRISNRMGWVRSKNPEDTRKQLEDWLPQCYWKEVNHLLVGFGQQICQPLRPQCATCLNNNICPFGIAQLKK